MAKTWTRKGPLYTGKSGLKQLPNGTWVEAFEQYKKDNPDIQLMGDKFINSERSKLKMPPKDYILPLPKPKDE